MNIVFFSHEVDAVSHVLTGKWTLPQIREALIKSVVFKDGVYELNPGSAITALGSGFELCSLPRGVENQVNLTPKNLTDIMNGKVPAHNEDWVLIEMPWGDIIVGGTTPSRKVTKQSWMRDWCNGNN
jgi:hypothetical protein